MALIHSGVLVSRVETKGVFGKAGVEPGDIILQINQKDLAGPEDFGEVLSLTPPEKKVIITVVDHRSQRASAVQAYSAVRRRQSRIAANKYPGRSKRHHGSGFMLYQCATRSQRKSFCSSINGFIRGHPPRCAPHSWFSFVGVDVGTGIWYTLRFQKSKIPTLRGYSLHHTLRPGSSLFLPGGFAPVFAGQFRKQLLQQKGPHE